MDERLGNVNILGHRNFRVGFNPSIQFLTGILPEFLGTSFGPIVIKFLIEGGEY